MIGESRDEVSVMIDGKDAYFDGLAWSLHRAYRGRRSCTCASGCPNCCSPATYWFDMLRTMTDWQQDMWRCLYERGTLGGACPPAPWADSCGPRRDRYVDDGECELRLEARPKVPAEAFLRVCNGGRDVIKVREQDFSCDPDPLTGTGKGKVDVKFDLSGGSVQLRPGESARVRVTATPTASAKARETYEGQIDVSMPFPPRIKLRVAIGK